MPINQLFLSNNVIILMQNFSTLCQNIDELTSHEENVKAIIHYFNCTDHENDKLAALALFTNKRPAKAIQIKQLQSILEEYSGLPTWLIEESIKTVGDQAEAMALLFSPKNHNSTNEKIFSLSHIIETVEKLKSLPDDQKKFVVIEYLQVLNAYERFLFIKLIIGSFRITVKTPLLIKALAIHLNIEENIVAHRLSCDWTPKSTSWHQLLIKNNSNDEDMQAYPFMSANVIPEDFTSLPNAAEYAVEYKWDGLRVQIIKRLGKIYIWSKNGELLTDKFPEFDYLKNVVEDGFVLDGEVIPYDNKPLNFQLLKNRLNRKNVQKNKLEECPISFFAYDILEYQSNDCRKNTYIERQVLLSNLIQSFENNFNIKISPSSQPKDWNEVIAMRQDAKNHFAEGIILKPKNSTYCDDSDNKTWWKWRLDLHTVDAVLIYANKHTGRSGKKFEDFTFAVWNNEEIAPRQLIPFTKCYSGLSDEEYEEIATFVKKNTIEKFGPVLSVKPTLVFEITFENIATSTRHKCGIVLKSPRINCWRKDKSFEEVESLAQLLKLIKF